jgi:hypothetical protein
MKSEYSMLGLGLFLNNNPVIDRMNALYTCERAVAEKQLMKTECMTKIKNGEIVI